MHKFETAFTVFPQDVNYNDPPCIFGGKMLAEMDNAAAMVCRRALYGTECTDAVTVNVKVDFMRPAYIGDIVHVFGCLVSVGDKSLTVEMSCVRESKADGARESMAKGTFVFCARKKGVPASHGLSLKDAYSSPAAQVG